MQTTSQPFIVPRQKLTRQALERIVAGRQNYRCANSPGANLPFIGAFLCPLWLILGLNGSFGTAKFHTDHKGRKADGGDDSPENFQALCQICHGEKTANENNIIDPGATKLANGAEGPTITEHEHPELYTGCLRFAQLQRDIDQDKADEKAFRESSPEYKTQQAIHDAIKTSLAEQSQKLTAILQSRTTPLKKRKRVEDEAELEQLKETLKDLPWPFTKETGTRETIAKEAAITDKQGQRYIVKRYHKSQGKHWNEANMQNTHIFKGKPTTLFDSFKAAIPDKPPTIKFTAIIPVTHTMSKTDNTPRTRKRQLRRQDKTKARDPAKAKDKVEYENHDNEFADQTVADIETTVRVERDTF